jgi:hypothetical protein
MRIIESTEVMLIVFAIKDKKYERKEKFPS